MLGKHNFKLLTVYTF